MESRSGEGKTEHDALRGRSGSARVPCVAVTATAVERDPAVSIAKTDRTLGIVKAFLPVERAAG